MSKLTMTSFVTLDGIMQAPGGPREDRSGAFLHGGWVMPFADEQLGPFMVEVFSRAASSRCTAAPAWPSHSWRTSSSTSSTS
jgi:hypothetical protein